MMSIVALHHETLIWGVFLKALANNLFCLGLRTIPQTDGETLNLNLSEIEKYF